MLKIIVATEADGLDTNIFTYGFDVKDETIDIEQAVKNACTEYCMTEEGKHILEMNCNEFNWGDFDLYVPNEICERYGFSKVFLNVSKDIIFNQQLVDEEKSFLKMSSKRRNDYDDN